MGRSARGDPPRGRCPGAGEVDSGERRLVVWISALEARVSLGTLAQGEPSQSHVSFARGAVDEAVRLGIAGARALGSGDGRWNAVGIGADPSNAQAYHFIHRSS